MDNGTMVETFKFLNYYQLATKSLVSKRFSNLIRTHRHKMALFYLDHIYMDSYVATQVPAVIKMFDKNLSPEKYNELIVRNGYSKQIPFECQISGNKSSENDRDIYVFRAYPNLNHSHDIATAVFYAHMELKEETWPLFKHFIRLITDPFVYIRSLDLYSMKVFTILVGMLNPDSDRLQCQLLTIRFIVDARNFIVWIKDHMHCDEFEIYLERASNCDEELLDLFLTGAQSTTSIRVRNYELSKVIHGLVQKFTALKKGDEYQVVESIRGDIDVRGVVKELKRNCAEFAAEEEQFEDGRTRLTLTNNKIKKKLTLSVTHFSYTPSYFSIKITNM